jgi:hypothetical protein
MYEGGRRVKNPIGRPSIIATDSAEAQIVADGMEEGLGVGITTGLVNEHRRQQCLASITKAAVFAVTKRLQPRKEKVVKLKQGAGMSTSSNWAKARFNWMTQLLIRSGKLDWVPEEEGDTCPDYFDSKKLEKEGLCFDEYQFASWDEVHRECTPGEGGIAGKNAYYKFPREEEGKLDMKNGEYSTVDVTITKVKYNEEVHSLLTGAPT